MTQPTVLEMPAEALERQTGDLATRATAMAVTNNQEMLAASDLVKAVAAARKQVADTFNPIISKAHDAHKEALAQKAKFDTPLEAAQRRLAGCIGGYQVEQERLRLAEQARLQKIADAEAETRRKAEAEEQALNLTIEAEADGLTVSVDEVLEQVIADTPAALPAPVVVARQTPAVAGISSRQNWKAQVTDLMALVKAVAAGTVPIQALQANDVFLGQQARSLREALRYPGVRAYSENSVAVRR